KEACGDARRAATIRAVVPDDFIVLSGEDAQTLEMLRFGAVGTISVTANVMPVQMAAFCQAWLDDDMVAVEQLDRLMQPVHAALFVETSPAPVKWGLYEMGRIQRGIRLPLVELSQARRAGLVSTLKQAGVLS
ncbi:MAG: dihydrodipicolinate synthase family protein, partial [Proteobacteria bacterium]|nr:dihydrodipicolinate synthase family protein [Pseudomonadota bacterium]